MKFLCSEHLSAHKYKTPEGYLICVDSVLARTGTQMYKKSEVFEDSNDDNEIEINRSEKEVFSPQAIASFENKPITVEHPDEDVNTGNYKEYSVGFVRDVHQGVNETGEKVLLGTLVITDARTIEEVENGEHTDLSCGYDCDIVDMEQKNIRGNHVALCQQGRAGIAHIVDSKKVNDGVWKYRLMLRRDYLKKNWKYIDGENSWDAIVNNFNSWKRQGYDVVIIEEDTKKLLKDSEIEGRVNPSEAKCNCDHPFHECGPNCECGCKDGEFDEEFLDIIKELKSDGYNVHNEREFKEGLGSDLGMDRQDQLYFLRIWKKWNGKHPRDSAIKNSYNIYTVENGKEVKIGSYIGDSASNIFDEFTEDHSEYKNKPIIIKKKDSINNIGKIVKIINKIRR